MCGGQETTKELESGIKVVHGCFMERGDSIQVSSVASCYKRISITNNEFHG